MQNYLSQTIIFPILGVLMLPVTGMLARPKVALIRVTRLPIVAAKQPALRKQFALFAVPSMAK